MSELVRFTSPRTATIAEEPDQQLGDGEVRIKTLYSGISAGTELTAYRGSNPYLKKRWDPTLRMFVPGGSTLEYPVDGWGYEEVGRVVELGPGPSGVKVGDVVWGTWGHRGVTVQSAEYASQRILPDGTDPVVGIFSQIGAIALNVVLDADIHIGETACVFGLGVPGQIVAQLARLNGARVIGVDAIPSRLAKATELGADHVLDVGEGRVAERVRELTDGRGADVCLEASGAYPALHEAIRSVAYSSRVVAAGFFQQEGTGLALGEEFHHNRVQVVCSQISGVPPALSHRWDRYRLQRTAIDLAAAGRLQLTPLITDTVKLQEAPAAFERLDTSPEQCLQVVIKFEE